MAERGQPAPVLDKRPILPTSLHHIYSAFQQLSSSRPMGMSAPGAIPLTEIEAYLRINEIDDRDEIEEFMRYIRAMDSAFIAHYAAKQNAGKK